MSNMTNFVDTQKLDYGMKDEDFATTDSGHIIHLNAACFANLDRLKENYLEGVQSGHFVQGTDWRAIARHETGHVVDNIYSIEPLELGMEILGVDYMPKMYSILKRELSEYSAMYIDGREIVSECFAGYYGKVQNDFANAFVKKCMEIAETARISSIHGGDTMKRFDESMYWMDNDDWFRVNYEKDGLELTPEAPQRAVESFELYLIRNDLPVEDRIIPASAMGRRVGM